MSLLAFRLQSRSALLGVLDFALKVFNDLTIATLKKNHLVRDNSHLKKGKSLTLGAREAFNDVVDLLALEITDDVLELFNDD